MAPAFKRFAPRLSILYKQWKALRDSKERRLNYLPSFAILFNGQALTYNASILTYNP